MAYWLNELDEAARAGLERDKQLLIAKYGLIYEEGAWYCDKENSHKHLIFREHFLRRADLVALLFRVNKLCGAKVKYFRANLAKYRPLRYDFQHGFIEVPLWDADFFQHRASGFIIDFRYLQRITVYEEFLDFCALLESYE